MSVDVLWPSYDKTTQSYIELDKDLGEHSKKHYLAAKEADLWNDVLPGLIMADNHGSDDQCVSSAGHMTIFVSMVITSVVAGLALTLT